jgi:hypothetical protein
VSDVQLLSVLATEPAGDMLMWLHENSDKQRATHVFDDEDVFEATSFSSHMNYSMKNDPCRSVVVDGSGTSTRTAAPRTPSDFKRNGGTTIFDNSKNLTKRTGASQSKLGNDV